MVSGGGRKTLAILCSLLLLISYGFTPVSGVSQPKEEDFRVLPINSTLEVNIFLYDVYPEWFEARDLEDMLYLLLQTGIIPPIAKSQLGSEGDFAPYEFEVRIRLIQPSPEIVEEYRNLLNSIVIRPPTALFKKALDYINEYRSSRTASEYYEFTSEDLDYTIRARDVLRIFHYLTEKYFPEVAGKYAIFLHCGSISLGRPPIYYTIGESFDSGKTLGDFGISIYGGPWWGRYYYIDLCAYPPPDFYQEGRGLRPIWEMDTATERIWYLASLIKVIIDVGGFVKSLIYKPRYDMQTLVDIIVIDATVAGLGFDVLVKYFDPEMVSKSLRTLMPYNIFNFRLRLIDIDDIRGLDDSIEYKRIRGVVGDYIIFKPYKAYDILKEAGVIEEREDIGVDYIPALILVTAVTSWVEDRGVLGIAIPRKDNPSLPLAATGASNYEVMLIEGLSPTIAHELAHTLGLRHPHDDFDEVSGTGTGFFPLTYFTETLMSYSQSWSEAVEREQLFDDYYPMRTFWSIFDLDAIDRAMITIMLSEYEENYQAILDELERNGISLDDVPEIKEALNLAHQYALTAVEEFKRHNYFNRLTFKGLGAQLESSLDYAYMARTITYNVKTFYLPGVVYEYKRLGGRISELSDVLSGLEDELAKARRELEEARARLMEKRQEREALVGEVEKLRQEVQVEEKRVMEVQQLEKDVEELRGKLSQLTDSVERVGKEVESLRGQATATLALPVVIIAVAMGLILYGSRVSAKRKAPPTSPSSSPQPPPQQT